MQLYDQLAVLEKQTIVAGNINGVLEETLRAVGNEAQEVCDYILILSTSHEQQSYLIIHYSHLNPS